jgi:uncharacterized membrane protein
LLCEETNGNPDSVEIRRSIWAEKALETLEGLQKQALIEVLDGAVVSWPPDKKKPKTRQLHSTTGAGHSVVRFGDSCSV